MLYCRKDLSDEVVVEGEGGSKKEKRKSEGTKQAFIG
jgi:hypothetical protein